MSNVRKCKVSIFGESYVLVTDESDEHVATVVHLVNSAMKNIANKSQISDTKRIAVLTAMQLASKVLSKKNIFVHYEQTTQKLIDKIDQELY